MPSGSEVKNSPARAGDAEDTGLIPGSERSPGKENGNSFQYSCLENPMERGTWRVTIHRVAKSQTQWSNRAQQTHSIYVLPGTIATSFIYIVSFNPQGNLFSLLSSLCAMHVQSLQSCPTLCDPMDCMDPPGSSVHGVLQARILEWVAMPSSRGPSGPRN